MESTIFLISCTPEEFWNVYEGPSRTDDLAETAMTNVVKKYEIPLREESDDYKLDLMVYGMLKEAPHPAGKRYVASALLVANEKGTVMLLANAWMTRLFIPCWCYRMA